jgi:hypothetical protein
MGAQIAIDAMKQLKAHVAEYHLDETESREMRTLIADYITVDNHNADR